jgi:uncharacterized membrane protein
MPDPSVASRKDPRESLNFAAAFSAGLLLAVRPRAAGAGRTLFTLTAAVLAAAALLRPGGRAVRSAGKKRRSGQARFSLVVPRPVEQVFALCADFGNLPRIFPALQDVIDYGDGRSHWVSTTPSGSPIAFDAVITKFVTNSVIGWRSVASSPVQMTGIVRFSPEPEGTCLRIAYDYSVASSSLKDSIAVLLTSAERRRNRVMHELAERLAEAIPPRDPELPAVLSPESVKLG